MIELSMRQALNMANVDHDDADLVRDLKFAQWVAGRKYQIVAPGYREIANDVEILIIKDSQWKKAITT